jgi:hypothetical protein
MQKQNYLQIFLLLIIKLNTNICERLEKWINEFITQTLVGSGQGSVVGITTGYGLNGPGIESRWGERFSVPVQTGPGAHPDSCTISTVSFPGVKSGRGVKLTPHNPIVLWS